MKFNITPTLIWYYYICPREVWLMSRHLEPDQENPFIEIGRLISEETYKKDRKEIYLDNMVIDLLKREGEEIIIGEVKKSSKYEKAAKMQLAYYLWRLSTFGIKARGELLFPKEKKRLIVELNDDLIQELGETIKKIKEIIAQEIPPALQMSKFCKKCGYQELCWA